MKASSFKYLTVTGLKNLWVNKLMSIASVGTLMACMMIIGVAVMLSVNVNSAMKGIEEQTVIMAYFNDKNSVFYGSAEPLDGSEFKTADDISDEAYLIHNEKEARAVVAEIEAIENVESVEYMSKEELLKRLIAANFSNVDADEINEIFTDENENPLSDGARIVLKDVSRYAETAEAIAAVRGVVTVRTQKDVAEKVTSISDAAKTAGLIVIGLLVIISFVIVSNTIRVTMYNRKLEISIMKAVGATDAFVRMPFIIEGVSIGLISSAAAFGIMYLMQNAVSQKIKEAVDLGSLVPFKEYALFLLLIFIAIGVLSGVLGSIIMMSKYLKKEGSEFRAL